MFARDEKRIARGTKALKAGHAKGLLISENIGGFRWTFSIAAPNFWHAPAAIMAMEAGKHVSSAGQSQHGRGRHDRGR